MDYFLLPTNTDGYSTFQFIFAYLEADTVFPALEKTEKNLSPARVSFLFCLRILAVEIPNPLSRHLCMHTFFCTLLSNKHSLRKFYSRRAIYIVFTLYITAHKCLTL